MKEFLQELIELLKQKVIEEESTMNEPMGEEDEPMGDLPVDNPMESEGEMGEEGDLGEYIRSTMTRPDTSGVSKPMGISRNEDPEAISMTKIAMKKKK